MIHENRQLGMRRARIDRFVAPVTQFIQTEAAGGVALLIAAIIALVWANSPWDDGYHRLLDHHLAVDLGFWSLDKPVHYWVNDGLMVIFFFVMGMEIKREMVLGQLATLRTVLVPVAAAAGGMIAPVIIFFAIVGSGEGSDGWGIPVATDIAFALGVLALLGPRIPSGLKVLLLALAIVDDIGGILVIAVFYTDTIDGTALALAVSTLLAAYVLRDLGIWYIPAYVALGIIGWAATVQSGVHPTIIGVAFGLLTPWRAWYQRQGLPELVEQLLVRFREGQQMEDEESLNRQVEALLELEELASKGVSPLDRLEHMLLPISAFIVVPIFSFANAGVSLSADSVSTALTSSVGLGIMFGLVVGKPIGITIGAWLAVRFGAQLPIGVRWRSLIGVGFIAGIGFTVSLLIADLSFDGVNAEVLLDDAKIGILAASILAGVSGYALLRALERAPAREATTGD
jgi:NhaA family Na+:H+ antiporter